MYKEFFSLARNPFDVTPDPSYFVSTRWHDEALATLHYGVRHHKGFIVVTGEVGTGKTLLLRCLLRLLSQSEDVAYAYLFNGRLSPLEFLQYLSADFGLNTTGKNKADLLLAFARFLTERGATGKTTVLIVDEAHHLSEDILEEIRLLSNLEMADRKLLQIILVGQPELDLKLDAYHLRQVKQRIALRAHLSALTIEETTDYVAQRLQVAGFDASREPLFPAETVAALHRHSKGLPRLINTICENALVMAYARQAPVVTPGIIDDVAREFRLEVIAPSQHWKHRKAVRRGHAILE